MSKAALHAGLIDQLVSNNCLSETKAEQAKVQAQVQNTPLIQYLAAQTHLDPVHLAEQISHTFGVPWLDLDAFDPAHLPSGLCDLALIRKHCALPLMKSGKRLMLAMSDPSDLDAINEIKFHTGCQPEIVVVENDKLMAFLEELQASTDNNDSDQWATMNLESVDLSPTLTTSEERVLNTQDEAPIVRFVNRTLQNAVHYGASDIHFEPYEDYLRVRFRQDGSLREVVRPPRQIANRLVTRLKVMAGMDIAEKRIPQDGRIKLKQLTGTPVDFRMNTLPTLWGEKIVLRILDSGATALGIESLGLEQDQEALYRQALGKQQGMILVTGPTGSGKTVTLYSGLTILNTLECNISTAEDPVELNVSGINQVAVNPKTGLDFASALRAFLRQDPDVIMVGEIRDLETAEIAIKAAQTGHLVLSTLHTNSAPEALTRLRNMGIAGYNLASSVSLIIAQRLLRKLCKHCKKPLKLPSSVLQQEGFTEVQKRSLNLYGPCGCKHCHQGYRGRIGAYQVIPITDSISRLIMDNGTSIQIAEKALQSGFNDLRVSALEKVSQGLTSLAEVNRLT